MSAKFDNYINLYNMDYDNAIQFLKQKYGVGKDDYFSQKSYERFLRGETKNLRKGNYQRTSEGLYCHHVNEHMYGGLSNAYRIKKDNLDFEHQKKENLVYCDLFEHTILHSIIDSSYDRESVGSGLIYMITYIKRWYLEASKPELNWEKQCYDRAYLNQKESFQILKLIELKTNPDNRDYSRSNSYEELLHYHAQEKKVKGEKYILSKKRTVENIQKKIEKNFNDLSDTQYFSIIRDYYNFKRIERKVSMDELKKSEERAKKIMDKNNRKEEVMEISTYFKNFDFNTLLVGNY